MSLPLRRDALMTWSRLDDDWSVKSLGVPNDAQGHSLASSPYTTPSLNRYHSPVVREADGFCGQDRLPLSYPNLPPVIPEGFYRVSRKNSEFKMRRFPMTNVGNDRRKTVADVILPDFVPEGPSPCPKLPPIIPEALPCHTRRFLSGIQKTQWSQKAWIPDNKRRE